MKKILATFLIGFTLSISLAQGQDNESENPLQSGSKALQFKISNNFNLSSFAGSTISYKRHVSEYRAHRIGVKLNNKFSMRDHTNNDINSDNSRLELNMGMEYTWMNYTNPDSNIKFYYGYGPGIDLGYTWSTADFVSQERTSQSSTFGISGIGYAGVEWFFQSSMSLHAEYLATVRVDHYRSKNNAETNVVRNKVNNTEFQLGGNGVRFGLSVYF
ncbi:MAG: hypothetical protein WD267_03030 [Balneolales bacterium]